MKVDGFQILEGLNMLQNIYHNTQLLNRLVRIALIGVIGTALFFAGFYYFDRYVNLNNESPLEMGTSDLELQVRKNPGDPEPRLALAEQYLRGHDYAAAIDQAQQVLNKFPNSDRALFVLGMGNSMAGNTEAGVRFLEQFVALHKKGPDSESDNALQNGLYYLGMSYLQIGRSMDAVTVLTQAVTINPTDADAFYQLGLAFLRTGKCPDALGNFKKAVLFVPDFAEAYQGMVDCYTTLQQPDYVLVAQGMQAFSVKDYQKASKLLSEAVKKLPNESQAFLGLGLTDEKQGDLSAAQENLKKALALDANNFAANNALERIQAALNQGE